VKCRVTACEASIGTIGAMDDVRIGNTLRVIRIRKHLRQCDVARRAGVSRQVVGRLENGYAGRYTLDTIRSIANALGARYDGRLHYRGAELDRIVNAAHAELHESVAAHLERLDGWTWLPEVTFAHYGERGIIDILAWHAETRSLLIIELKTELVDPQGLVAVMHRRVRLGRDIAAGEGWRPLTVNAWVIVRESSADRRRAQRHARLLKGAFPDDGRRARGWMAGPVGTLSALSFWSDGPAGGTRRLHSRVRRG
jgi:transcriptional regulator with XRE-family HTH domain